MEVFFCAMLLGRNDLEFSILFLSRFGLFFSAQKIFEVNGAEGDLFSIDFEKTETYFEFVFFKFQGSSREIPSNKIKRGSAKPLYVNESNFPTRLTQKRPQYEVFFSTAPVGCIRAPSLKIFREGIFKIYFDFNLLYF